MNIRPDVVEAIRNPTFTVTRNTGRKLNTWPPRRLWKPTETVQLTRRSDPVLLERWP